MKNLTKRLASLFLALALVLTCAMALPTTASAASKPKTKKATLKITDTKISGFKKITGTISINNKYVIAYGKNNQNQNVYAYSSNGKKFGKATLLGLEGNVDYRFSNNAIYVFSENDKGYATSYKYAANPKSLSGAAVIDLTSKFALPTGSSLENLHCYSGSGIKGKMYMTAYYSGRVNEEWVSIDYSVVLDGTNVTIKNLHEIVTAQLPNLDINYVNLSRNYYGNSYKAIAYGSGWDKTTNKEVNFAFMTSDGINFTKLANLPTTDNETDYDFEWINNKLYAFGGGHYDRELSKWVYTAPQSSDNKAIFYVYSGSNWTELKTSKSSSTGFLMNYHADAYYYDNTSGKDAIIAQYNIEGASQIIYSTNGKSWKSLAKLTHNKTALKKGYEFSSVQFNKTNGGTYAIERYRMPYEEGKSNDKVYLVISKLSNKKWKTLKAIAMKDNEKTAYSTYLYGKTPTLIYNNGNSTVGYNLSNKKSYKMPFKYTYNSIYGGEKAVYYQNKNLYVTSNGYKNVTKVTLKVGSKNLSKKISSTGYGYVKKVSYEYLICGNKMYYVTYKQLNKIK